MDKYSAPSDNFVRNKEAYRGPNKIKGSFTGSFNASEEMRKHTLLETDHVPEMHPVSTTLNQFNDFRKATTENGVTSADIPSGYSTITRRNSYQRQMSMAPVQNITDLNMPVEFDCLSQSDEKFSMISKYIENSHGLKESQGKVNIHNIYEINKADWIAFQNNLKIIEESDVEQMLLWYKTTAKGVQKLVQGKDDAVVLYDRICRAFPENLRNIRNPTRQLIILCAVSLGKIHESPLGFCHWSLRGSPPAGYNSVIGAGKSGPCWDETDMDDSFIVPNGETTPNQPDEEYKLEFSEYILFEAKRINVKYVVDVEVIPSLLRRQASYGTAI
ncbi:unnamed protein product [Orchesella dallaii]|uniref:PARP catalytic domain-containing protein n=1 Tax=Orchesella dallaii TaxID=48710 RepID=A0ABP1RUD8_9HEXA